MLKRNGVPHLDLILGEKGFPEYLLIYLNQPSDSEEVLRNLQSQHVQQLLQDWTGTSSVTYLLHTPEIYTCIPTSILKEQAEKIQEKAERLRQLAAEHESGPPKTQYIKVTTTLDGESTKQAMITRTSKMYDGSGRSESGSERSSGSELSIVPRRRQEENYELTVLREELQTLRAQRAEIDAIREETREHAQTLQKMQQKQEEQNRMTEERERRREEREEAARAATQLLQQQMFSNQEMMAGLLLQMQEMTKASEQRDKQLQDTLQRLAGANSNSNFQPPDSGGQHPPQPPGHL